MSGLKQIIEKQNLHIKSLQKKNEQFKVVNKNLADERKKMIEKINNLEIEFSVKNSQLVKFQIFYTALFFLKYVKTIKCL